VDEDGTGDDTAWGEDVDVGAADVGAVAEVVAAAEDTAEDAAEAAEEDAAEGAGTADDDDAAEVHPVAAATTVAPTAKPVAQ